MFGAWTGHHVTNCDSDNLGGQKTVVFGAGTGHGAANCDNDNLGGQEIHVKFPIN